MPTRKKVFKRDARKSRPTDGRHESRRLANPLDLLPDFHRSILDRVPQNVYCTDLKGRLTYANKPYCRVIGRPLRKILGKTAYDFFPKALADKYARDDRRVIRTGETLHLEEVNQPPGHEAIHVRVVKMPLRDERGKVVGVQGTFWDVSEQRRVSAQINEQAQLLRRMLDTVPDYIYFKDTRGRYLRISRAMARSFGLDDPAKAVGKSPRDFYPARIAALFRKDDLHILRTGKPVVSRVEKVVRRDGHTVWHLTTKIPLRDQHGRITGIFGVTHDITRLKETEHDLARQNRLMTTLMDSVPDYIYFKDLESRFILNSRAHLELLGLTDPAAALGKTDFDFFVRERAAQFRRDEEEVLRTGRAIVSKEEKIVRPDGKETWNSTTKMPWRDADGRIAGTMGISRDVTDRKRTENLLYQRAFYDPLTNLPNRALLMDRLSHLFRRAERNPEKHFAVLFLDLDRFKSVNDSLGHEAGDALLIATARRLEACLRPGDTVARLGGDEFTVLLEEVRGVGDAVHVAQRILSSLAVPVKVDGTEVFSTVSIGVALSRSAYKRPEDLLRDADTAMYGAKAHGRSRYEVFDRAMHDRAVMLLETETDLRRALERNEFRVHYQPVVRLEDRRILGFEALVRWQHPQRGLLLPEQFIAMAEELGLLGSIGLWVLREACRQTCEWQKRYPSDPPWRIGVNVSSRQLQQKGFLDQVRHVLKETDLDPACLTLEVTEKTLLENLKTTAAVLAQLRRLHVQVHIDDFGTDYLLLRRLGQYPADTLKIDPSFVKSVGRDAVHAEVMRTIVHLARSFGMKVTAEGVETDGQLQGLRAADCSTAQGFLFSEAVEAATAESFLSRGGILRKRSLSEKRTR